jgi:hypothetical protein
MWFLVNSTPGSPTEERVERWISRRSGCHLPATRPFALGGPQSLGAPKEHSSFPDAFQDTERDFPGWWDVLISLVVNLASTEVALHGPYLHGNMPVPSIPAAIIYKLWSDSSSDDWNLCFIFPLQDCPSLLFLPKIAFSDFLIVFVGLQQPRGWGLSRCIFFPCNSWFEKDGLVGSPSGMAPIYWCVQILNPRSGYKRACNMGYCIESQDLAQPPRLQGLTWGAPVLPSKCKVRFSLSLAVVVDFYWLAAVGNGSAHLFSPSSAPFVCITKPGRFSKPGSPGIF